MMLFSSIMIHYNINLFLKSTLGINLPSLATHPLLFEWLDRPFNTLIKGSNPIHTTFKGTGRDLLIGTPSIFCEISPFAIIHRYPVKSFLKKLFLHFSQKITHW